MRQVRTRTRVLRVVYEWVWYEIVSDPELSNPFFAITPYGGSLRPSKESVVSL